MRQRIQAFIRACLASPPGRQAVQQQALDLFRWQREHNPVYRSFCGDAQPVRIDDIPSVPVGLFRDQPFCTFEPVSAAHVFHTSGTTTGNPGVHRLLDTETYDLAAGGWFRRCVPDAPELGVSLIPSPSRSPNSSLSHMVGLLYPDARWLAQDRGLVDAAAAWRLLAAQHRPVFIASTALSLATLLSAPGACRLPAGSVLMTTGGFKGRHLLLDPAQLLHDAASRLGGGTSIVGEYGMTELSSQLWTRPWQLGDGQPPRPSGPFYAPPWLVPLVVDPGSGAALPVGQTGQLRFVDLANDHSVLAIETMDQGTRLPDGGLELHGRLPGAVARGCSLGVEDALLASKRGR